MSIASLILSFKSVQFQESDNFYNDSDSDDDYDDDGLDAIIREGDLITGDPSGLCDDRKPWIFGSPGSPNIQQLLR